MRGGGSFNGLGGGGVRNGAEAGVGGAEVEAGGGAEVKVIAIQATVHPRHQGDNDDFINDVTIDEVRHICMADDFG